MKLRKKNKNTFIENFLILLCSIFIVSCLFVLNKNNFKINDNKENEFFVEPTVTANNEVDVQSVIDEYKSKYNVKNYYILNKELLSFWVYDEENSTYSSLVFDYS